MSWDFLASAVIVIDVYLDVNESPTCDECNDPATPPAVPRGTGLILSERVRRFRQLDLAVLISGDDFRHRVVACGFDR